MIGRGLVAALALALAGCASLPAGAPTAGEVTGGLQPGDVDVVQITPQTPSGVSALQQRMPPWSLGDAPARALGIQPGDVLGVSIYEVGYALFAGGGQGDDSLAPSRGGGTTLPAIRVPEDGQIHVPFAGSIDVLGLSGSDVARRIEGRLRGKSQNAQAVVSVDSGPRRSVVLSGDVKQPGRIDLTEDNERLLDAIALASGPEARAADTVVSLSRGGMTSWARLDAIASASPENVRLAPGDRIELTRDVRSITVLGAAGKVSEVNFDGPELLLSEALARAGGLLDERADATGLFVFRQEWREGPDGTMRIQPVIYRLNLLDPASYFAAQNFAMRERDVMLVANAGSNRLDKVLRMINGLATPIVTADLLTR